jgi:peptidoglycan/LPS O-acetylase OafA/YrhL
MNVRDIAGRFSRVTTSGGFIAEIDGLRFVAIGTVVLFHLAVNLMIKSPAAYTPPAGNVLATIARQGFHGVELFFIISGFILAVPFASHHLKGAPAVSLRGYFLRRVTRLEPPYIACMTLFFVAWVTLKGHSADELLPHLGASLLYLHNLVYGTESPINNVAWSLEIEIQFYLLVPLLASVFVIRERWLRRSVVGGVAAICAVLAWAFVTPETPRAYWSILRFLHFFLLGFLLADVFLVDWRGRPPARSHAWDLVSLVGWPALFVLWTVVDGSSFPPTATPRGPGSFAAALGFPAAALMLYLAAFRGRITNAVFTNVWITTIGGMCYTIYLLHNPVLGVLLGETGRFAPSSSYTLNLVGQAVVVLPVMLVPCAAYFLGIEKPCMRKDWPKRLLERARSGVLAVR